MFHGVVGIHILKNILNLLWTRAKFKLIFLFDESKWNVVNVRVNFYTEDFDRKRGCKQVLLESTRRPRGVSPFPRIWAHHLGWRSGEVLSSTVTVAQHTPPRSDCNVHGDANGKPAGLGSPGRCVREAAEETETGHSVPAQGLRRPAASGRPQEARNVQPGGMISSEA